MVDLLFVYGTLMRGESNHDYLAQERTSSIVPATIRGTLYDFGEYPGLRLEGGGRVHGELVELATPAETLAVLDELEEEGHEFERTLVEVDADGERRVAWTYVYARETAGAAIASGDWRKRRP
jgi:gamma-glutamylcyclotransferase (GGCT)/AIG2-like uncharacterized protein YtfP